MTAILTHALAFACGMIFGPIVWKLITRLGKSADKNG